MIQFYIYSEINSILIINMVLLINVNSIVKNLLNKVIR